jgi:hypothetical protein
VRPPVSRFSTRKWKATLHGGGDFVFRWLFHAPSSFNPPASCLIFSYGRHSLNHSTRMSMASRGESPNRPIGPASIIRCSSKHLAGTVPSRFSRAHELQHPQTRRRMMDNQSAVWWVPIVCNVWTLPVLTPSTLGQAPRFAGPMPAIRATLFRNFGFPGLIARLISIFLLGCATSTGPEMSEPWKWSGPSSRTKDQGTASYKHKPIHSTQ